MSIEMYNFIVDNLDRINIDIPNGVVITPRNTNGTICKSTGYLRVKVNKKTLQVHQILAVVYYGESCIGMQVNHKDGNKLKNVKSNLELVTREDNIRHQRENGWGSYLKDKRVRQIDRDGNPISEYPSIHEASRSTGIGINNIQNVIRGYNYSGNKRYLAGGYRWELVLAD